jgi:hypothetical protein
MSLQNVSQVISRPASESRCQICLCVFPERSAPSISSKREQSGARDPALEIFHLVGTPKGKIQQHEKKWPDLPWQQVRESVCGRETMSRTANSMYWPRVKEEDQAVRRETFQFRVDKQKLQEAEWRDGHYLLRSNLMAGDPSVLRTRYEQLTQS